MNDQILKGTLLYPGFPHRPWPLVIEGGEEIDFYPIIDQFFIEAVGKRFDAKEHTNGIGSIVIQADESSELILNYQSDQFIYIMSEDCSGCKNLHAYLDSSLTWLTGRKVIIEFREGSLTISPDPTEEVFGVKFFGNGNQARIPEGSQLTVCKVGQGSETCVFATMGSDGWSCQKFEAEMARFILSRRFKGTMGAQRLGNCALIGREEEVPASV